MPKVKNPFKYPLKSRAAIIAYLLDKGFDYPGYVLSFNVKINNANFEFDHLLKRYSSEVEELNPTQIAFARQWYTEHYGENKYQTNDAQDKERSQLFDWSLESAQRGVTDDDAYTMICDGTPTGTKAEFRGRSDGYIVFPKFDGYVLKMSDSYLGDYLTERENDYDPKSPYLFPYETLRKLYKFHVECDAMLNSKAAESEIEFQAAYTIFGNLIEVELNSFSDDKVLLHV